MKKDLLDFDYKCPKCGLVKKYRYIVGEHYEQHKHYDEAYELGREHGYEAGLKDGESDMYFKIKNLDQDGLCDRIIEPFQVYTTPQASELVLVSEKLLIELIKNNKIKAKYLGKGWKILGKHLIEYFLDGD